jgi:hypothetical protein
MKRLQALPLVAALALLGGCADEYFGYGGYYQGYYDGYYGPLYSGYWAPDGFFYYSVGRGRPFIRDDAHHFRRDAFTGYHHFRVRDHHRR